MLLLNKKSLAKSYFCCWCSECRILRENNEILNCYTFCVYNNNGRWFSIFMHRSWTTWNQQPTFFSTTLSRTFNNTAKYRSAFWTKDFYKWMCAIWFGKCKIIWDNGYCWNGLVSLIYEVLIATSVFVIAFDLFFIEVFRNYR